MENMINALQPRCAQLQPISNGLRRIAHHSWCYIWSFCVNSNIHSNQSVSPHEIIFEVPLALSLAAQVQYSNVQCCRSMLLMYIYVVYTGKTKHWKN